MLFLIQKSINIIRKQKKFEIEKKNETFYNYIKLLKIRLCIKAKNYIIIIQANLIILNKFVLKKFY